MNLDPSADPVVDSPPPDVAPNAPVGAPDRRDLLAAAAVFAAAVIGRLPALGAWWNQDDWGLIGRAAGLAGTEAAGLSARFLSQQLWWTVTWPLFGLDPVPHAWSRLLLHGLSAVLVVRIGRRAGLTALAGMVAGLLFAATPLAFTPLYWAAGVQEILAVFFALVAVERWLAGGRRNILLAVLAATLSILSKESGLGLPLLLTILLWSGVGIQLRDKAFAWAMCLLLLLVAVIEGVLVLNHFGTDAGQPYATGGPLVALANLGVFGWWLASPGPVLASRVGWGLASAGLAVFVLWGAWSVWMWRQRRRLPAAALAAALLSLGPALPLAGQIHPYLACLAAAAGSLTLASALPRRWGFRLPVMLLLVAISIAWGFGGMRARLQQRDEAGLPADPVVRSTSLSWDLCRRLPEMPLARAGGGSPALTFLQIPLTPQTAEMAGRLGDRWVSGSSVYHALGGMTGPSLVLGDSVRIDWVNSLRSNPADAIVLCEAGPGFRHWGTTSNAALYAALTDIGLGHFERARHHIVRAADLGGETVVFSWDPSQMVIPLEQVLNHQVEFIDWTVSLLESGGASGQEVGGLQDLYFQMLTKCTGRSFEELTAGTGLLRANSETRGAESPELPEGE